MADIVDYINDLERYFKSDEFLIPAGTFIDVLQTIAAIFIVLIIINMILLGIRLNFYKKFVLYNIKGSPYITIPEEKLKKQWRKIQKNVDSKNPNSQKLAILNADKILDHILEMAGYDGENLKERLEKMNDGQIENIEELKKAHKVKDMIVDDPKYVVSQDEAKEIINHYETALHSLDVNV